MAKNAASGNGKKGRQPAPEGEDKARKFSRIATMRVQKAVKALSTIGNLSSAAYEKTPEQVEKIDSIITQTWSEVMEKFNKAPSEKQSQNFTI